MTIIDNAPHLIDVVSQILKLSGGDRIQRVRCETTNDTLGLEVEDRAEAVMTSGRGRSISLVSTWSEGPYRMNLDIRGTRGRVALTGFEHLTVETEGRVQERDYTDVPGTESWELDIHAFVDAIRLGAPVRGSGEDGLRCVKIIEALYRSAGQKAEEVILP